MADYVAMYRTLFNAQTDAIRVLQQAQQKAEEMYLSAPGANIRVIDRDNKDFETNE